MNGNSFVLKGLYRVTTENTEYFINFSNDRNEKSAQGEFQVQVDYNENYTFTLKGK